MELAVVGIGYKQKDITIEAIEFVQNADLVIVKTKRTKPYSLFKDIEHICLDYIFERAEDFESLYSALADEVIRLSTGKKRVAYCVEGEAFGDYSVVKLKEKLGSLKIISGIGCPATRAFEGEPYYVISAYELVESGDNFCLAPNLAVTALDDRLLASELKLLLLRLYDSDCTVLFFEGEKQKQISLCELDMQAYYGWDCSFALPKKPLVEKQRFCYSDLIEIMNILMGENGCPWDKEQTHSSIRANCLEEAYETVDAIDLGDSEKLKEETGDLMLQSIFHALIAQKYGEYDHNDKLSALCHKLISRHTHIFGGNTAADGKEALASWEAAKAKENPVDLTQKISQIPAAFPAMLRAEKTLKAIGYGGTKDLKEAFGEFYSAADEHSLGQLLLSLVAFYKMHKLDSEGALKKATDKLVENLNSGKK